LKEVVDALSRSKQLHFDDVELKVMPELLAVALAGYVALNKPSKSVAGAGAEIKRELEETCGKTGAKVIVQVNSNPCMVFGKEMGHAFSITQKFDSARKKQEDIERMKRAKMISFHAYPLRKEALETGAGHCH